MAANQVQNGNANLRIICLEPPVKKLVLPGDSKPTEFQTHTKPLIELFRFCKVQEEPLKQDMKEGIASFRQVNEGETPDLFRFTLDLSVGRQAAVYKMYSAGHSSSITGLKFNNPNNISIQMLRDFSTIYLEDGDWIYVILNTIGRDDNQVYMTAMAGTEFREFEVNRGTKAFKLLLKRGNIDFDSEYPERISVRVNIAHDDDYALYHTLLFQDGVKLLTLPEHATTEAEVIF